MILRISVAGFQALTARATAVARCNIPAVEADRSVVGPGQVSLLAGSHDLGLLELHLRLGALERLFDDALDALEVLDGLLV